MVRMIDTIRNALPSGLKSVAIEGCIQGYTQRVDYPGVVRRKQQTLTTTQQQRSNSSALRKKEDVIANIMPFIDEAYPLYTAHMQQMANTTFIKEFRKFIGDYPGRDMVTRKESREIMKYLANTKYERPPDGFFRICSFLLNATIHVEDKTFTYDGIDIKCVIGLPV
jgi:hypothetical protein